MSTRYLSACAIFKWEWPWLLEWIRYHELVGVDHFHLYANEEGDDLARSTRILQPWVDRGLVTLSHLSGDGRQLEAYRHAIAAARGHSRWLAVIDLDEFLYPIQTDALPVVLEQFEAHPALAVNWLCFGSSGLLARPPSQIMHFLRRGPEDWTVNRHVKCIVDPASVSSFPNPHFCAATTIDENRSPVKGPFNRFTGRLLRINHYLVRSRFDFEDTKMRRGRAMMSGGRRTWEYFFEHDRNEVFDDGIAQRFGTRLGIH